MTQAKLHSLDQITVTDTPTAVRSMRTYYLVRAGFSASWVAAAATIGLASPVAAAALLIAYPAWDAVANMADALRNGGFARNISQTVNALVSGATAVAVAASIGNMHLVLGLFGVWAILAGILQLATSLRRRRSTGAQWPMMLSGAQSALAGGFFLFQSLGATEPSIVDIAPYAAFGAFYFAASALWLFRKPR